MDGCSRLLTPLEWKANVSNKGVNRCSRPQFGCELTVTPPHTPQNGGKKNITTSCFAGVGSSNFSYSFGRKKNVVICGPPVVVDNNIPPLEWLSMMDHGQAITNTFQRPVFFLSVEESLSFIHTNTAATDGSKPIPPIIGSTELNSQGDWRSELKEVLLHLQPIKKI
ncbi:hypothetical protein VP01_4517g1 [Puccinia sorghi]|uniref:Uncharacterized protein n=1 Tax=Puccinia sorghi TaxID=27349 RepID=A0A0L6UR09_9BASI|nr:hypothetical protein VP01_4517g1 [Puccinia sorghi]